MTAPTPPAIPDEPAAVLRRMRLPYVRAAAPDVLATARAQRWDPAEVLRVLLVEEAAGRGAATRRQRRKAAGFPTGKTFDTWRETDSSIPIPTQSALRTLEWVGRAENLAISGPSGTGKSHFVEALAGAVIDAGMRVWWFTLRTLTNTVGRAKVDASIPKVVARICRAELIVIDLCRPRDYPDPVVLGQADRAPSVRLSGWSRRLEPAWARVCGLGREATDMAGTRRRPGRMGPFIESYREVLLLRGYTPLTVRGLLQHVEALGRWMAENAVEPADLDVVVLEEFLEHRRAGGRALARTTRSMASLLNHLRDLGVVAPAEPAPVDPLLAEYRAGWSRIVGSHR